MLLKCIFSLFYVVYFFFSTQVNIAQLGSSSIPQFPKQTNYLNFHLYFYFLLFLRFFCNNVIFLKFPEDVSFNRNKIKLFSFLSLFSSPFPWICHCHDESNLHFLSFLYCLFLFSVAHQPWGSFSSQLCPIIFTFVLVLWEQSVQALHAASVFFLSSHLYCLWAMQELLHSALSHEPKRPETGQENLAEGSR